MLSSTRYKTPLQMMTSSQPNAHLTPVLYSARPSCKNFTSASDFFAKNCLPLPPAPASSVASVADVSKPRLVQNRMAGPGARSVRDQIPSDLPPHLQHLNVQKGGRRRHRIKQLGAPTDFIKVRQIGYE